MQSTVKRVDRSVFWLVQHAQDHQHIFHKIYYVHSACMNDCRKQLLGTCSSNEVDAHKGALLRGLKQTLQAIRECTEGSLFSYSVFMRELIIGTMQFTPVMAVVYCHAFAGSHFRLTGKSHVYSICSWNHPVGLNLFEYQGQSLNNYLSLN